MQQINNQLTPSSSRLISILSSHKDRLFKASQYVFLFMSWYYQSRNKPVLGEYDLQVYKFIFYSRRLHRLGHFITFLRPVLQTWSELRKKFNANHLYSFVVQLFKLFFYLLDSVSIVLHFAKFPRIWYLRTRRASFACFLISLIFSLIYHMKKLRRNFSRQHYQPVFETTYKFMRNLKEIDDERWWIALTIFSNIGDIFPAVQRMSISEELIYTRINKGTVAFFGLTSAVMDIIKAYMFTK